MKTISNHTFYNFEESLDLIFGEQGTPERDSYEVYAKQERQKEKERQHSVRIPASIYESIQKRASSQGMSVTAFVRQTFASMLL